MGIDLASEKGLRVFYDLVRISDVVFDNSRPSALAKMGADYKTLKNVKDDIICCSLSGYGKTGPDSNMPAYDITIQARGGSMSLTGEPGSGPRTNGPGHGRFGRLSFFCHSYLVGVMEAGKNWERYYAGCGPSGLPGITLDLYI